MAARSGQAFRNLLKLAPRSRISNVSKCSYSILSVFRASLNSQVRASLPVASQTRINRRFYGDHADDESLEDKTMNVLKLFDKIDPSKVNLDAHLINDLGLDSLDVVEVVMAFEDEFGIEISDEEAEKIFTVTQAVELIKLKM